VLNEEEMKSRVEYIEWTLTDERNNPKGYILKNQFAVLDLLANNQWERPVYFAVTTGPDSYLGLEAYFRLEGLAYRLVPIRYPENSNPNMFGGVSTDTMYENVMSKWHWGGMDNLEDGIYMDENNRRMVTNFRLQMANLGDQLLQEGDPERALDIFEKVLLAMPDENVPFGRVLISVQSGLLELATTASGPGVIPYELSEERRLRAKELGGYLTRSLFDIHAEDLRYFLSLNPVQFEAVKRDRQIAKQVTELMVQTATIFLPDDSLTSDLKRELNELDELTQQTEKAFFNLGSYDF
jgi:hypothetical protein